MYSNLFLTAQQQCIFCEGGAGKSFLFSPHHASALFCVITIIMMSILIDVSSSTILGPIKRIFLLRCSVVLFIFPDGLSVRWLLLYEQMVYTQAVSMMWLDELLETLKQKFVGLFSDRFTALPHGPSKFEFEKEFESILHKHEQDVQVRVLIHSLPRCLSSPAITRGYGTDIFTNTVIMCRLRQVWTSSSEASLSVRSPKKVGHQKLEIIMCKH